jgi:hypothetical protein
MKGPQPRLDEVVSQQVWESPEGWEFPALHHINLQEFSAFASELVRRIRAGDRDSRLLFLNDSRVVVGAFTKGRSSSIALNRLIRQLLGPIMCAGLQVVLVWISTSFNPADYPSRGLPLPPPAVADQAPQVLIVGSGQAGLRNAFLDQGVRVRVVEWSREAESLAFETVGRGGVRYLHLVLPATTLLQVQSERDLTPWWAVVVQEVVRQGGLWSMQWVGGFSDMADTVVGRWETRFQALRGQWDMCQCLWRVGQAWVRGPPRALSILTTVADAGAWGSVCPGRVGAPVIATSPLDLLQPRRIDPQKAILDTLA